MQPDLVLEVLYRSITVLSPATIFLDSILASTFVLLEVLHLFRIHILHNLISLPLLEREASAFVRVVFVISLILVILQLNEIGVDSRGIEGQGNKSVDGGGLWDELKSPRLDEGKSLLALNSCQRHDQ